MFSGKKVYDITRPIQAGMTVWPGDREVSLEKTLSFGCGDAVNVSEIHMGVHTGTHMDAPLHFIEDGEDIEAMSLDKLMGEVLIVETTKEAIDVSVMTGFDLAEVNAVFFKTASSQRDEMAPFYEQYTALTEGCARFLVDCGVKTIGIDYLSIEQWSDDHFSVHKHLLAHKVAIVENLCLKGIGPGRYSYVCLPLKIKGADGSPCRVLLFK